MSSSEWVWPVPSSTRITSKYKEDRGNYYHKGVDIGATPPGTYGAPIVAASGGKVISSGTARGYGQWIRIDHGNGVISIYGHMQKRLVKVGDIVEAGTPIAEMGSEGESSGPHLHFQIDVNREPQDPMKYINPEGVNYVDSNFTQETENSYIDSRDAGGVTVGQRASGVTPQPVHAFINIWLGDMLLSTENPRPNIIRSFEYDRAVDAGGSARFVLFDDNWEEIEYALAANYTDIEIEYGYYGIGAKSKRIKLLLQDYNIDFEFTGTTLSINALTEGAYDNLNPKSIPLGTYNPTKAVKIICENLGYKIKDEYFDESKDIESDNPFNLVEDLPISYIYNVIIPQTSRVGEELFVFYIDDENYPHFERQTIMNRKTDKMRTYIYQRGYDSNVINFSVDTKGVFAGSGTLEISSGYRSSVINTNDKSQDSEQLDIASVVTESTGDVIHTNSKQSIPVIDSSGYTASQMKSKLYYKLKSALNIAYEATLTIVGDPTLDYIEDRYIRIINITDEGNLHHTSGVYIIQRITDSIEDGKMITILKLGRNATPGDIDGIEIINPKYFIK